MTAVTPLRLTYEDARNTAQGSDAAQRRALAARADPPPEVLYFLANDGDAGVRRAVAANIATPAQADALLAVDADPEVRAELARKLGRLLPDLDDVARARVRERVLATIDRLSRDELPRIRTLVAEAIKRSASVPKDIVLRLAADIEALVAVPIIEYSPLLNDQDLLEIIAHGTLNERLSAIARRPGVSAEVTDAIVATCDVSAVAALLANPRAQIREDALDALVEQASGVGEWHEPLVLRPELSQRAMRRLGGFVAAALIERLVETHALPADFAGELRQLARTAIADAPAEDDALARARELHAAGELDEGLVVDAADNNDRRFVLAALSLKSALPLAAVERAFTSRSAKAIIALAWKAGFSMRLAMKLQVRIAALPGKSVLHAKGGTDFPISPDDMNFQIAVLNGG